MARRDVLPSAKCTASASRIGNFRGSMAGLCVPLSTLRRGPRGHLRMTRGRCGSLLLHRKGLAPSTPCRSPGASQMFSGVPGKRASDFALMSTRLDSKATAGPIPCAVSTGLTGVLTCLHVHIRVHLFTRKPNFFSCAASVPARGCPPHGFLREEGPASPILMRSRCRWSNGAAHLRGACADRTATMIRSCSWTVVRLRAPTSELM